MCLATLNIEKARDSTGYEIEPKYEVTDALIRFVLSKLSCPSISDLTISRFPWSHPKPFQCRITARSAKAKELVMSIHDEGFYDTRDGFHQHAWFRSSRHHEGIRHFQGFHHSCYSRENVFSYLHILFPKSIEYNEVLRINIGDQTKRFMILIMTTTMLVSLRLRLPKQFRISSTIFIEKPAPHLHVCQKLPHEPTWLGL